MEKIKIQITFNHSDEETIKKVIDVIKFEYNPDINVEKISNYIKTRYDKSIVIWNLKNGSDVTTGSLLVQNDIDNTEYLTEEEFLDKFKKNDDKKIILSNHAYEIYSELKRIVASGALKVPIFSFSYGGNIHDFENFKDDMFKLSSELQDEDELPVFRSILGDESIIVVEKKEEPKYILSYEDSNGAIRYFQLDDGCETYTYGRMDAEVFTSYYDAESISLSTVYGVEEL